MFVVVLKLNLIHHVVSCEKNWFVAFKVTVIWLIYSKCDCFSYVTWTFCYQTLFGGTSSQALWLICFASHSEGWKLHWISWVWFELFNFLLKSFLQKNCYATIKVKVTVRSHMAQIYHFYYILRAADPFDTKHSLMIHHHKLAKRFDSCVQSQGHSDGWILHWILYFLYLWYLHNKTRYVDVLLLVSRHNANKVNI